MAFATLVCTPGVGRRLGERAAQEKKKKSEDHSPLRKSKSKKRWAWHPGLGTLIFLSPPASVQSGPRKMEPCAPGYGHSSRRGPRGRRSPRGSQAVGENLQALKTLPAASGPGATAAPAGAALGEGRGAWGLLRPAQKPPRPSLAGPCAAAISHPPACSPARSPSRHSHITSSLPLRRPAGNGRKQPASASRRRSGAKH